MSTASVNKVILIGNLGRKPELRDTASGQVTGFSLATSRSWATKQGEKKEVTTWHRVVVWGNQAASCAEYLDKGSQVYVEGSLEMREYTDNSGQVQKITEVRARDVRFLGKSRPSGDNYGHQQARPQHRDAQPAGGYGPPIADDDVPF